MHRNWPISAIYTPHVESTEVNHIWLRVFPNAFFYMIPLAKFTVVSVGNRQ